MKYYIIGGGITGLTIAHCLHNNGVSLDNIRIYTKDVGGQIKNNVFLGPRILRKNLRTYEFLKSLGLLQKASVINVGYLHEGHVLNDKISKQEVLDYCKKTNRECTESTLSDGMQTFEGWHWEEIGLLDELTKRYESIIEIKDISVEQVRELDTQKNTMVISTVNLFHKPNKEDMRFISFFENAFEEVLTSKYTYVYDLQKDSPFKRVNFGKRTVYEAAGDIREIKGYFHITTFPQVYSNTYYERDGSIILEGRFARLQHSCKLEDVITRWL